MTWFKSKEERLADSLREEQLYELVGREVADGNLSAGLWTKAFAQAQGDEQRARGNYIKLRVEQLKLGFTVISDLLSQGTASQLSFSKEDSSAPKCPNCGSRERVQNSLGHIYCGGCNLTLEHVFNPLR